MSIKNRLIAFVLPLLWIGVAGCQAAGPLPSIENTPAPTPETATPSAGATATSVPSLAEYRDIAFDIDGTPVVLKDGVSEVEAAPGSATKIVTRYFGNEAFGDLNGDGLQDVAFLLTQTGGGSGTFYYVVAALRTLQGFTGSNAVLLGDRIAPQSTRIQDGLVLVNYADRKPGEDFATQPSVGVTKNLGFKEDKLVEILTPSQITNRAWKWVRTQLNDDTMISPKQPGVFTITLGDDGKVTGTTDCNNFFGSYTLQDNQLSFGPLASTKMYCEGSQETDFLKYLTEVQSYLMVEGQLVLEIRYDSGQLIFE